MDIEDILKYSSYPKSYAASLMGISLSDLTAICKKNGIQRWPYHAQRTNISTVKSPFIEFKVKESAEIAHEIAFTVQPPKKEIQKGTKKQRNSKGEIDYILDKTNEDCLPSIQHLMNEINSTNQTKKNSM